MESASARQSIWTSEKTFRHMLGTNLSTDRATRAEAERVVVGTKVAGDRCGRGGGKPSLWCGLTSLLHWPDGRRSAGGKSAVRPERFHRSRRAREFKSLDTTLLPLFRH